MKQRLEGSARDAADGEHAGDPPLLAQRGLKGDVDAGRPTDDHGSIDAVGVHHREQIVGVVGDGDPRLVGGALRAAQTSMVPRHNSVGLGPPVDIRPGIVWGAKPVGDHHGNPVAFIAPRPQTGPINGCDRSEPQRPPCLLCLDYLIDGRSAGTRTQCSPQFHCSEPRHSARYGFDVAARLGVRFPFETFFQYGCLACAEQK